MSSLSPFAGDWRACLQAHYQQVLRNQDHRTEDTLTGVLQQVGFSDAELAEIRLLATIRADEMGPDFVPDFEAVQAGMTSFALPPTSHESAELQPEPAALETEALDAEFVLPDEPEPVSFEAAAEEEAPVDDVSLALPPDEEPPDFRAAGPQQLSMF